jgi:hypothetical protein
MKLREIIESYEGLEDADEFGDSAETLHAAAYDLLPERIQYWGKADDIISNCVLHGGNDPESIADYVIDAYLEYGYELADTPSGYPEGCEPEPPSIEESYEGLEDADEFNDPRQRVSCVGCGSEQPIHDCNYTLCFECGSSWCPDCMGDTYDPEKLDISDCAYCENRGLHESYEGLEDSDEFRDSYEESCAFCGRMYDVNPQDEYYCRNCGRTTCPDCEMTADRLPDGEWDMGIYCSSQCRRDHRTFEEATQGPIIKRIQWSPAAIYIQYPSGDIWEYVVYEDRWLRDILRSHRRNVGRVVAELKKLNVEARKVNALR